MNLNGRGKTTPGAEAHDVDELPEIDETIRRSATGAEPAAPEAALDEFDAAIAAVGEGDATGAGSSEQTATPPADPDPETPVDPDASPADADEDRVLTDDELLIEAYQKDNNVTHEQAVQWLASAKAAQATEESRRSQQQQEQDQNTQRAPRPQSGGGSAIGALFGVAGAGLGKLGSGIGGLGNAALRGSGFKRNAGMTPELVKKRLFDRWHSDYESGVKGMERTMTDLLKAASAYNQLVKTTAPGRELEKIAKSKGTDLRTLLSGLTAGTVDDVDAKAAMNQLVGDPHVQRAWNKVEASGAAYGDNLEKVMGTMGALQKNFADKLDLGIESARLEEIHGKHSKVEKPFELPANPINDENKANGKSKQKSMWEQFQDMTQRGSQFIQALFEKISTYVAGKFGR